MNNLQWQKLDPDQLPESPGIYAILWRRQWLYLSQSANLKRSLEAQPWPYRIGRSLSDAELLWMQTEDHRRQEGKLRRMLRCKWQGLDDAIAPGLGPNADSTDYPHCLLPDPRSTVQVIPMVARPLTHVDPLPV